MQRESLKQTHKRVILFAWLSAQSDLSSRTLKKGEENLHELVLLVQGVYWTIMFSPFNILHITSVIKESEENNQVLVISDNKKSGEHCRHVLLDNII